MSDREKERVLYKGKNKSGKKKLKIFHLYEYEQQYSLLLTKQLLGLIF